MRTPTQYLPAALSGLRARLMPDCAQTMRHGGDCARVVRVGSHAPAAQTPAGCAAGDPGDTSESVATDIKVLAAAADFPDLEYGSVVAVDDVSRMVVDVQSDPARVTLKVSLSRELDVCSLARDPDAAGRTLPAVPFRCIAAQDGRSGDLVGAHPAFEGTALVAWSLHVPRGQWPLPDDPRIGQRLSLSRCSCTAAALVVQGVQWRGGVWHLVCSQGARPPEWGLS